MNISFEELFRVLPASAVFIFFFFFSRGTRCVWSRLVSFRLVSSRRVGHNAAARIAHAASSHDQGTMYNSFFMVVSSNQVLVICQERDSVNVRTLAARLLRPRPLVSGFHSLSCESHRRESREPRLLMLQNDRNTAAIQSRLCIFDFLIDSARGGYVASTDKLQGVRDDRLERVFPRLKKIGQNNFLRRMSEFNAEGYQLIIN